MSKHANSMDHASVDTGTTWQNRASGVSFTILGQPASLKNSRRIVRQNGKTRSIKSETADRYMRDFYWQVPPDCRRRRLGSLKEPLRMICTVFYSSRRSDLDVSAILDALQTAGVISNDRFVIEQHLYAEVDAKNPRAEITVEYI